MSIVRAAGGVVTRVEAGMAPSTLSVLLVHRPRYDDWSLPKGKVDSGDRDLAATARREIAEETGLTCVLSSHLGSTYYVDSQGRDKTVDYWLARPTGGDFVPGDEVDAVQWLTAELARTAVTRDDDAGIIDAAAHAASKTRFVTVIRHGAAVDARSWKGSGDERPLVELGLAQSLELRALAAGGVTALCASPATRCRDTLAPLSKLAGIEVETNPRLAEGSDPTNALDALVRAPDGAFWCTHGDVLDGLLTLAARGGAAVAHPGSCDPASSWMFVVRDGIVRAVTDVTPVAARRA